MSEKEPLLCPFRKKTTHYHLDHEPPEDFEEFLPCLQEKCEAWLGGFMVMCGIPHYPEF